ncbi:hypothetical protein Y1Q_0000696 [Alligator mississippiensis]|nr:hypothetical protein Y1Q_0000696 [Alligator mississippiensis]
MREIKGRHTSEFLKTLVMDSITNYGIKPMQLYSGTDNGSNMVKMVQIMIEDQEEDCSSESSSSTEEEQVGMKDKENGCT